jgi:hypothetical protein
MIIFPCITDIHVTHLSCKQHTHLLFSHDESKVFLGVGVCICNEIAPLA